MFCVTLRALAWKLFFKQKKMRVIILWQMVSLLFRQPQTSIIQWILKHLLIKILYCIWPWSRQGRCWRRFWPSSFFCWAWASNMHNINTRLIRWTCPMNNYTQDKLKNNLCNAIWSQKLIQSLTRESQAYIIYTELATEQLMECHRYVTISDIKCPQEYLGSVFGRTDFSRIFFLSRRILSRILLPEFFCPQLWKNAQWNPRQNLQNSYNKIPHIFLQRGRAGPRILICNQSFWCCSL